MITTTQEKLPQTAYSRGILAIESRKFINPDQDAIADNGHIPLRLTATTNAPSFTISASGQTHSPHKVAPVKKEDGLLVVPVPMRENTFPVFDTPEAAEDEAIWESKFASTPDDKLHRLAEHIRTQIRAGKAKPLDFTNR